MTTLGLSERQLAARSRVSLTTVKELARNTAQRHRHHLTLSRLSRTLGLDLDHLRELADQPAFVPEPELQAELDHADLTPRLRTLILDMLAGTRTELREVRAEHNKLKRAVQTQLGHVETLIANSRTLSANTPAQ
ncbi:hypothetical protein [Actinokineospora terrae]|nr:hypothetical protein [Actinokineospora terrae]